MFWFANDCNSSFHFILLSLTLIELMLDFFLLSHQIQSFTFILIDFSSLSCDLHRIQSKLQ